MRIGAHVDREDPLAAATERKADVVQFFLSDPLRIAQEELDDISLPLGGGGKRIFTVDVGPDAHAASLRRPADTLRVTACTRRSLSRLARHRLRAAPAVHCSPPKRWMV